MKRITATVLMCSSVVWLRGQEPEPAKPPQDLVDHIKEAAETARAEAHRQVQMAQDAARHAVDIANQAAHLPVDISQRLRGVVRRGTTAPAQPAIIRFSEGDAKEQTSLGEDLTVMSHILEKAVGQMGSGRNSSAMGIDVFFSPGGSPQRSFYLEGYGALFMLQVNFPLLATSKAEQKEEKPSGDSAWQEAREEVYGEPGNGKRFGRMEQPYDEQKVSELKNALVDALRNATNIRGLKGDECITVSVAGGGGGRMGMEGWPGAPGAEPRVGRKGGAGMVGMMTVRVKKADADAFAKGRMTLEEFRKRARINIYAAPETSSANGFATSIGVWEPPRMELPARPEQPAPPRGE